MKRLSVCAAALVLAACGEAPDQAVEAVEAVETVEAVGAESSALSGRTFGAYCQQDYQDNWRDTLDNTWDICGRFNDDLDDTDTKAFYFNAHGAKTFFEESGDALSGGLDTVDLVFFAGHGGAFTAAESSNLGAKGITATHTMWDTDKRAFSANMRLGDDGRGLSILSTYTCETHAGGSHPSDVPGQIAGLLYWNRWIAAFRGGLRMSTSTVQSAFFGSSFADIGKRYSNNLQAGQTFSSAWSGALNIGSDNDPSLITTGSSAANCTSRLDTMTWQNHASFPRLRDGAIGSLCRRYWENI